MGQVDGVEKLEKKILTNMSQMELITPIQKQIEQLKDTFEKSLEETKKLYAQKMEG